MTVTTRFLSERRDMEDRLLELGMGEKERERVRRRHPAVCRPKEV
jgi:hypothetical protein